MAKYAVIENGTITGVYDLIPENWRNISNLPAIKDDIAIFRNLGWRTVIKNTPVYNLETQRLGNPTYEIINDEVYETIQIIDLPVAATPAPMSEEQLAEYNLNLHNAAVEALRIKRDKLLQETDYTQLADVMAINGLELTTQFQNYRQLLRDLPAQYESDLSFVDETTVIYPTLPGAI